MWVELCRKLNNVNHNNDVNNNIEQSKPGKLDQSCKKLVPLFVYTVNAHTESKLNYHLTLT